MLDCKNKTGSDLNHELVLFVPNPPLAFSFYPVCLEICCFLYSLFLFFSLRLSSEPPVEKAIAQCSDLWPRLTKHHLSNVCDLTSLTNRNPHPRLLSCFHGYTSSASSSFLTLGIHTLGWHHPGQVCPTCPPSLPVNHQDNPAPCQTGVRKTFKMHVAVLTLIHSLCCWC